MGLLFAPCLLFPIFLCNPAVGGSAVAAYCSLPAVFLSVPLASLRELSFLRYEPFAMFVLARIDPMYP